MRAMNETEREYWLMCYPDQTSEAKEKGLGPRHFYVDPDSIGGVDGYYTVLMTSAKKAAGLLKMVQGRRFIGTKTILTENGKKYDVPDYEQFDSASCVRVDVNALVSDGKAQLSSKPDSSGAWSLYVTEPELPASVILDVVNVKLSDPSVPSFDSPRDAL